MAWIRPPGPVAPGLRIGLLGGSFNPAHEGHLHVSETALKRLGLDYVWWLVSPGNPLKGPGGMASFDARMAGARRAARHPRLIVTDIERQMGTRYTIDTVQALRRRFPGVRFTWLMGSDNLVQLPRWRRWREIVKAVPVAVVMRPDSVMSALNAAPLRRFGSRIAILDGVRNAQSATWLRSLGAAGATMLDFSNNRKEIRA